MLKLFFNTFFALPLLYKSIKHKTMTAYYIEFLNAKKQFKKERKFFATYEAAKNWALKNFEKFNPDMIVITDINE